MTDAEIIKKYHLERYLPTWESLYFHERAMRFGIEAREYDKCHYGDKFDIHLADCQTLVSRSFLDDMVKFIRNNSHISDEKLHIWAMKRYA